MPVYPGALTSPLRSKPLNGRLRPVNNSYDVKAHHVSGAGSAIMEESATKLTELQFAILNGMASDYEDVEQLYLNANHEFAGEKLSSVQLPRALVQVRFPLRDIVDEITNILREGYIEAKYSNNEELALLRPIDSSALHHYWFGATDKGTQARKAYLLMNRKTDKP
jgi:hypothetical protein